VMFVGLTAICADDKKDDKKDKLVGVWEATKGDAPKGATLEFSKDGKLKIAFEADGKKIAIEGTFKVDGDSLETNLKGPDGKEHKETMKIKTLTEKELVTEDEKGKIDEFKKQEKK
ncbi:MAG TPA: TIGR03066 family protein, partial [Gemmataceae bacterium]